MEVGLYFGSFNPIHIGHLIIGNFIATHKALNQVWFIVSPQNPFKNSNTLLNEYHRLHLVNLSIEGNSLLKAVDVEFKLPRPSYTIDTLTYLKEKYPTHVFSVIIGGDSLDNMEKWKNYEELIKNYKIVVYERPGFISKPNLPKNVEILKAPLLEISSSYIRQLIKEGRSIQYLVVDQVREEIEKNNYYK
jgi:nicotinate-nucleotide adenylyltransferase